MLIVVRSCFSAFHMLVVQIELILQIRWHFYRKDVQENLRKEKQDLATMKRNCRAIKQKNQKLEKELRKQNKKVGIIYIKDMTQSFLGMLFCAFAYHIVCNA